jgi:ribosomal protein S18 acetylase RimI-like enzyme
MERIEVVALTPALLGPAAVLVADYAHPAGWGEVERAACEHSLSCLLESGVGFVLLARWRERFAGFASLTWGFSIRKGKRTLLLHVLFTHPECRRQGVARALVREAIRIARERDATRLQLDTGSENVAARTLYDSLGFEWFPRKEIYMLFL